MALGNLFHLPHHKTLWDASGFFGLNDFVMALLTGHLYKDVYMAQPSGFIDLDFPSYVANSIRWSMVSNKHHRLKQFLVFFSFINSHANTSLFILNTCYHLIFLVYVDDLIITGDESSAVIPHKHSLLLLQHRYNKDLVCTKMIDVKPIVTPLATNPTLTLHSSTTPSDLTDRVSGWSWESSISISHLTRYYISNQHVISIHALPNN
ncbi:Retrovirus-related Pol polyprotein from transposon RE2 [Vitis vinifera]|uniref:Retrovirus-related Pol polyprotein from transposon RE2 n=1 Tax=Vitis vinifera TaxID=29760 RepID=A0A438GRM9_VITVI|nr:Retrovirus-related Pol polyprotein from transposon RE2 [Vitis vinifera]